MKKRFPARALVLAVVSVTVFVAPLRADAVTGGTEPSDPNFTVKVLIGDSAKGEALRGCSGARFASDWVLTTATCVRAGGAAPATNGGAPAKRVTVGEGQVSVVALHPSADVALLRTTEILRDPAGAQRVALAAAAPAAGETVRLSGFGRTNLVWAPLKHHEADFRVTAVTATSADVTPIGGGGVCKGDAGGPVVRVIAGRPELVGLISTGSQGGCLDAAPTDDHNATIVRVDGLSVWAHTWTLNTGFETTDPVPSTNTPAASGSVSGIGGFCCSLTGPELGVRAEQPHTGSKVILYSGNDTSETKSFAYMKAYAAARLPVTSTTLLRYWIYPQDPAFDERPLPGPASRLTDGTCVAVDLDFSDGKHLRDLKAFASNGATDSHPARQCGHLRLDAWNEVTIDVGQVAAGKLITQVNIGYDRPEKFGVYRGLIDDIEIFQGCLAHGSKTCPTALPASR